MATQRKTQDDRRATFGERFLLWWSDGRYVDGLWVGSFRQDSKEEFERILERLEDALRLIKTHDPVRYEHILRDLERVWVTPMSLEFASGSYNRRLKACELSDRLVMNDGTTTEVIAATIVHEATHARLMRCAIGYEEKLRARVEGVCMRREIAFAAKLPDGKQITDHARYNLELVADGTYLTDVAFRQRYEDANISELRRIGVPDWAIQALLALRALIWSIWRFGRFLKKLNA